MSIYAEARDKLIPEAERRAKERLERENPTEKKVIGANGKPFKWDDFNQYFFEEMDELLRENWINHKSVTFGSDQKERITSLLKKMDMMPPIAGQIIIHCANGKAHSYDYKNNLK